MNFLHGCSLIPRRRHVWRRLVSCQQLRWSVERGFEIIGEALSQLRKIHPEIAEGITDWRAIISFRNVLIHAYSVIKHEDLGYRPDRAADPSRRVGRKPAIRRRN